MSLRGSKPRPCNYTESKPAETWRSCSFEEAGGEQGADEPLQQLQEETPQFRESTKEAAAARAGALRLWGNLVWEERQGRRSTDRLGNANGSRYVIGKLRQGAAWACLLFPLCLHVCHAKNDAVWTLYNAWLCPRGQEPESRSIRTARALSQGLRKLPGGAACPCLAAQPDFSPVPAREQRGASPCPGAVLRQPGCGPSCHSRDVARGSS